MSVSIDEKYQLVEDVLKCQQHELYLLKNILTRNKCDYSENASGIRINLKTVADSVVRELIVAVEKFKQERVERAGLSAQQ